MYDKLDVVRKQIAAEREREAKLNANLPPKSLFELLQENELKKDEYFEGQYAERNALKRLDTKEISHIQQEEERKKAAELLAKQEEQRSIEKFKKQKSTKESDKGVKYTAKFAQFKITKPAAKSHRKITTAKVEATSKPTADLKSAEPPIVDYNSDSD